MAMLLGAGGLATMIVPSGTRADSGSSRDNRVDVSLICLSDTFVRIAASNDSPLPVEVSAAEIGLGSTASDELRAIFPIRLAANSKRGATFDLTVPAHVHGVARHGLLRMFHGSFSSRRWVDSNGLTYRSSAGISLDGGRTCPAPAPATSPSSSTSVAVSTTSAASSTSTSTPQSTSTSTALATLSPTTSSTSPATTSSTSSSSSTEPTSAASSTTSPETTTTTTVADTTTTALQQELVEVAPVAVRSTTNSQHAPLAFDHRDDTAFVTQMQDGSPPTWAWVAADLGRPVQLSRIEWMWATTGSADDATIRVSVDGSTWDVIETMSDGAPGEWMGHDTTVTARYVRFYFRNPKRVAQLGNLAEARLLAAPGAPGLSEPAASVATYAAGAAETRKLTVLPPHSGDVPAGQPALVIASSRSSNSAIGSSRKALDGDPSTAWSTAMSVAPWSGWLSFDLGVVSPLRAVQWQFSQADAADSYRVQVSADGRTWTTVAVQANPPAADQWLTLPVEVDARFVRFYFKNPNLDIVVGQLSEVRLFVA
jgi:F5/8 type C domain